MSFYFYNGFERTFGTWPLRGEELKNSIKNAVDIGYRSFDTAQMYNNEEELGNVLSELNLKRYEFCITTKVLPANYSKNKFLDSVVKSLNNLKLEYVDVLLLHWPNPDGNNSEALEGLQKSIDKGYTKNIGISNYTISMMKDAMTRLSSTPVCNQVEFHPLLDTKKIFDVSNKLGIPLSAYCSLAKGKVGNEKILKDIAVSYNRTPEQISLKWILQKGVSINTMSTNRENMFRNFNILDFTISGSDVIKIDNCMKKNFRIVNKDRISYAPVWD